MVGITIDQCIPDLVHAAQVCPAGWNPGSKSMKGDHIGSQEYFGSVGKEEPQEVDFGTKIRSIKDKNDLQQTIQGPKPAVVEFFAPW